MVLPAGGLHWQEDLLGMLASASLRKGRGEMAPGHP